MTAKVSDCRLFLLWKELEPVKAARDLGVYNEHIVSTVSSCMSRLGQINRVKHIFDKLALTIIINALVFSTLFYCSSVWSNTSQAIWTSSPAVQNFACRILCGAKKIRSHNSFAKRLALATNQVTTLFSLLDEMCFGISNIYPRQKIRRLDKEYQKLSALEHTTLPYC